MAIRLAAAVALALGGATAAWGHAAERGFVLLLPTGHYIVGGTLAVAASFLLLLLAPAPAVRRLAAWRLPLGTLPRAPAAATSALAFLLVTLLVTAGFAGSRDPLANPLPLTVWTLWWVGLTVTQAVFGNLWAILNPWIAPARLLRRLARLGEAPLPYPAWLGYWPATLAFLAFACFELVDPAPDDPARLAWVVIAYSTWTFGSMLLFGERAWLARGEAFTVFFGFVARIAPLRVEHDGDGRPRLSLALPGAGLAVGAALPAGGVAFVLLTLATVSFDGFNKTFWWLDLGGINPLEFPGRTALVPLNSAGLAASWAVLAAAYGLATLAGGRLAGRQCDGAGDVGAFVLALLPISIGYHVAHYLTVFLVNAQYALPALGDPFGRGWDLLGLEGRHVTVSFLSDYHAVSIIWKMQVTAVVIGHVLAVLVAHVTATVRFGSERAAALSQLPLAVVMIGYTLFGLWLLASPVAG